MNHAAVLRIGPIRLKWSPVSRSVALCAWLLSIAIYAALFIWYANTAIAHTYPEEHSNFWFGLLHGWFALPSFIVSWFSHDTTIYQSPNDGFWYNLGFLLGIGSLLSSFRRSR